MIKKTMTLLAAVVFAIAAAAESYTVTYVSQPGIKANGVEVKKGTVITNRASLQWKNNDATQVVKLIGNESRKTIVVTNKTMKMSKSKSISQLLVQLKGLATRDGAMISWLNISKFCSKPLILLQSASFQVPYQLDAEHVVFLQYDAPTDEAKSRDVEQINKILPGNDLSITITDSIFLVDGKPTKPQTRAYRLYYYDIQEDTSILLANDFVIDVDLRDELVEFINQIKKEISSSSARSASARVLTKDDWFKLLTDYIHICKPKSRFMDDDLLHFIENQCLEDF